MDIIKRLKDMDIYILPSLTLCHTNNKSSLTESFNILPYQWVLVQYCKCAFFSVFSMLVIPSSLTSFSTTLRTWTMLMWDSFSGHTGKLSTYLPWQHCNWWSPWSVLLCELPAEDSVKTCFRQGILYNGDKKY